MSPKDRLSVIKTQISVMRDKVTGCNITYDKMTNRMFTLLGAEIAISGLFTSPLVAIPYPSTDAGKIFFYGAISSMAFSVAILMYSYRTIKNWPSPMGPTEVELMDKSTSEMEALELLYEDYRLTYEQANKVIAPKAKALNASLLFFFIGAIILIVLKFGG